MVRSAYLLYIRFVVVSGPKKHPAVCPKKELLVIIISLDGYTKICPALT
ncbi:hypothetical protein [Mediterraneibacter massiliensis]|nr:hypothetical protein [Mediterraneibacter massiliensis]